MSLDSKTQKTFFVLSVLLLGLALVSCKSTGHTRSNESGKDQNVYVTSGDVIPKDARCPVCGMFPARYEKFAPKVVFSDGTMAAFDGCKDMFKFLQDLDKYGREKTAVDIDRIDVKDYATGKWIDGRSAHYLVGSSVRGPMGSEILPFETRAAAKAFGLEKGGTIKPFAEITKQMLERY